MRSAWCVSYTIMHAVFVFVVLAVTPTRGFLTPPSFLQWGSCSDIAVQPGLDLAKFAGRWFTVAKMPNEYDPGKFCINTQYTYHGDHMTSTQRGLYEDRTKQKLSTYLVVPDTPDPVLTVITSGMPNAPLKIVSTDYEKYACLYTCLGLIGFKAEFGMVLTRQPVPPASLVHGCFDVFTNHTDIHVPDMEIIEQGKDCPYWEGLKQHDKRISDNHFSSLNLVQPNMTEPMSSQHVNAGRLLAVNFVLFMTSVVGTLALTLRRWF